MQRFTTEYLLNKNLKINQPEKGYRFSADPFLLCSEIPNLTNQTILDIGCGSGVISLILKSKNPGVTIFGVEIQKELAEVAKKNVAKNAMGHSIQIIYKDIKLIKKQDFNKKIDIIVSNPPYKKEKSGRLNPDKQKAIAKHEIKLNIKEFFICCKKLLVPNGKVYMIFPAERISELFQNMEENKIKPEILRFVHTRKEDNAKLVIISGIKNGLQQPVIAPPLYTYEPLIISDQPLNKS